MKYSQVLDLWYNEYCLINHKESTCISYKKSFQNQKALGNLNVTKITTLDVQKFINQLARERVSRNSIVCYKGMITNSLDYAIVTLNIISENKAKTQNFLPNEANCRKWETATRMFCLDKPKWKEYLKDFPRAQRHTFRLLCVTGSDCEEAKRSVLFGKI